jgi:hypothetical protein
LLGVIATQFDAEAITGGTPEARSAGNGQQRRSPDDRGDDAADKADGSEETQRSRGPRRKRGEKLGSETNFPTRAIGEIRL